MEVLHDGRSREALVGIKPVARPLWYGGRRTTRVLLYYVPDAHHVDEGAVVQKQQALHVTGWRSQLFYLS